jgi:hypothetical protein
MGGNLQDFINRIKAERTPSPDIQDVAKRKRPSVYVEGGSNDVSIGAAVPEAIVKAEPTILPTTYIGDYSARVPQPMNGPPGLVSSPRNSRTPLNEDDKRMLVDYGSYLGKNNPELTPEQIAKRQHDMVQPKPVTLRATENAWVGR